MLAIGVKGVVFAEGCFIGAPCRCNHVKAESAEDEGAIDNDDGGVRLGTSQDGIDLQ